MLLTLAFLALVAWRIYARVRRSIGRQVLSPKRAWVTGLLVPVLLALVLATGRPDITDLVAALVGVVAGCGLGAIALHFTHFEVSDGGVFYTPNPYIGMTLTLLLLVRIGYRFLGGGFVIPAAGAHAPPPALTPTTLLIFGALAGYSTTHAVGLIRKGRHLATATPASTGEAKQGPG